MLTRHSWDPNSAGGVTSAACVHRHWYTIKENYGDGHWLGGLLFLTQSTKETGLGFITGISLSLSPSLSPSLTPEFLLCPAYVCVIAVIIDRHSLQSQFSTRTTQTHHTEALNFGLKRPDSQYHFIFFKSCFVALVVAPPPNVHKCTHTHTHTHTHTDGCTCLGPHMHRSTRQRAASTDHPLQHSHTHTHTHTHTHKHFFRGHHRAPYS